MGDLIANPYDSEMSDNDESIQSGSLLGTAFAQRDNWRNDILEKRVRYPWQEQPSFGESWIPVWGAARSVVADLHEGDYLGAGINAVLSAADLQMLKSALAGAKVGVKISGPMEWDPKPSKWVRHKDTREVLDRGYRDWYGKRGYLSKGQDGHHSLIPKRIKWVPDFIKNGPWNILPMESSDIHQRIHRRYKGMPRFGLLERYERGIMPWAKSAGVEIVGRSLDAILDNITPEGSFND